MFALQPGYRSFILGRVPDGDFYQKVVLASNSSLVRAWRKRIKCVVNFKGPLNLFVHVFNFFTSSLVLLNYASYRRRAARIFFKSYYYLLILLILNSSKIKSLLYSRYYAEACNEWRGPSPRLSAWTTQPRRIVAAVASRW